jgi:hypothetical protein
VVAIAAQYQALRRHSLVVIALLARRLAAVHSASLLGLLALLALSLVPQVARMPVAVSALAAQE